MKPVETHNSTDNECGLTRCQRGVKLAIGALCTGALVLSAGCGKREDKFVPFEGVYFKTKASPVDKKASRADFTVSVKQVSQSLDGARQAGGYEGTKYCIAQYGTSKIKWSVGPDTAPENLTIADDTLIFSGRCDP